jgi:HSP20 family protein
LSNSGGVPFRISWSWIVGGPAAHGPGPLGAYEEGDRVISKPESPGVSKEDIQVDLTGSTLTIKGEKKSEEETKEEDYCCCQRSYGSFRRSIELPAEVKVDQVEASFKNRILEIRLPKTEEARKKITKVKIS